MPTKTWAVGEEVLAADFNSYVQQQVVSTFANVAARDTWASPPNGARCVTLDTGINWERRNGVWLRSAPGVMVQSWTNAATESGDITGATAVLSLSINVEANRMYQVLSTIPVISRSGSANGLARLLIAGTNTVSAQTPPGLGANAAWPLNLQYVHTAASTAAVTFTVDLQAVSGTIRFLAAAGYARGWTITDMGPV